MKKILLTTFSLIFVNYIFSQNIDNQDNNVIYPTEFHITEPLRDLVKKYFGKILYKNETNFLKNSINNVDLNKFSNGIYFIKSYNSKINFQQKIIKIN